MLRAYSKSDTTGKRPPTDGERAGACRDATDYGANLLATLGITPPQDRSTCARHPALVWAESGAMALTGLAAGPPVLAPGRVASCARGALHAFAALAGNEHTRHIDGAMLLGERAAILGLHRRGTTSPGGSCRLLRARDGWIAVNLPRPDDLATLPAWLEIAPDAMDRPDPVETLDPWDAIAAAVATRPASPLVARARLLGLAVAPASMPATRLAPPWQRVVARGPSADRSPPRPPLVLDLSGLWAGPLAAHLLLLAGARVIKIESLTRPDGARRGPAPFYDLLNAGKESVALDFATRDGRAALTSLIARADIVIESARPRALTQLGNDAARIVRTRAGLTWISVTGYGRSGRAADWIAFGDDAATAAGLAHATAALAGSDVPIFCGDAIADPLTGMHAALAALAAHRSGGGVLLSLALRDVAAHVLGFGPHPSPATVQARHTADGAPAWEVVVDGERQTVLPPRARPPRGVARPLGADTDAVLRALHG